MKRKTTKQRFEDWWKRNTYLHHMPIDDSDLRDYMRVAYRNGWSARARLATKKSEDK